ncbi:hypothetical protein Cgig2_019300 [Carnegiea gigantea]|uniref:BZIP domain-containing protein n=1 Tax=Carnegiea gigantea TaxID=171969 RepID=A0A9Q1KNC0_9CARY|nr:hypothetical protein Cgig2_019300 [Carnegiea gigantea]
MASSGGTSSGSSLQQNSSSEEEIQLQIMYERKRKRMQSNRESARRSRMRKQKHLNELTAQITHLNFTRHQLISNINATNQHYLNVEAENSVLRAQMAELINRLESLNEISNVLIASTNSNGGYQRDASFDVLNHRQFFLQGYQRDASFNVLKHLQFFLPVSLKK